MPVDKFGNEIRQRGTAVKSDGGISLSFANKTYIRLDGESDITGNLNMALRKIENLGDPTNPKDATSKKYVDNTKGKGVIGEIRDDTATIKGNLDFTGQYKIQNLPVPVDEKDAVSKEYVDTTTAPFLKLDQTKYNAKGDIDMNDLYTVYNVKKPVDDTRITNKKYVDEMDELKTAFALRNGGYYAKGTIYLRKNKLGGLREPIQDEEATTKKYVDDLVTNHFIDENSNIAFGRDVDMEGNRIFSLPEPEQDNEPTTKKYVDDLQNQYIDKRGNMKFGRNINLDNKIIFALKEPKRDNEASNRKYVDDSITKRLQEEKDNFLPQDPATKQYVDDAIKDLAGGDVLVSKEGVFIKANGHYRATAPLDIDNQKMENVADPVDEKDAVNKKYIDEVIEALTLKKGLIRENGGFNLVDSYINMNFNHIRNVGYPKHTEDAVPRNFVDNMIKTIEEKMEEKINKRKQLISVTASYHGALIKGDYQFTFGGQSVKSNKKHNIFNGFLVPSSGYIKKFVVLDTGIKFNAPRDKDILEFIVYDIGYNNLIPLFTFVSIRYLKELTDIGTLYFYFVDYGVDDTGKVEYTFKFNPNFEEKTLRTVRAKDIINIRSEFNSIKLSENRIASTDANYNNNFVISNDFFTYLATILIELDPLDD